MAALEKAQEELNKKSSGSKNWIQASKLESALDFRVQDPLPQMQGIYYQMVPVWWIDGKRVVSSKLAGPGEVDIVESIIDQAKATKDKGLLALINAQGDKGPKIQYKEEFWIPILKFNWQTDKNGAIQGITDASGNIDPNLVRGFIEDGVWKILVCGIMTVKAINVVATSRGGLIMTDPTKGFNLILTKTGVKKDTKYTVVKDEVYPMPLDLYAPDVLVDPYEVGMSLMYTEEYKEQIICKYLYNEELPERTEACYAYPEIREKLKALLSEDATDAASTAVRPRPGRAAAVAQPAPAPVAEVAPPVVVTAGRSRTASPVATRGSVEGPSNAPARAARPAAAPARAGRPGRNVASDLQDV